MKRPFLLGLVLGLMLASTPFILLDKSNHSESALPSSAIKANNLVAWKKEVENAKQRVALAIESGKELDEILETIYRRAVKQGEVTAREMEAGVAAIDAAGGDQNKVLTFSKRMLALQRSFGVKDDPSAKMTPSNMVNDELNDVAAVQTSDLKYAYTELANTHDPQQRTKLYHAIELAIATLPEQEQLTAIDELNAHIEDQTQMPSIETDLNSTLVEIQFVDGEEKQALVQEYTEMVMQLDEEEQNARLTELNTFLALDELHTQ